MPQTIDASFARDFLGRLHRAASSRDADAIAALANAGGMGFITPRSFDRDQDFAAAQLRCAELSGGKPFGVNPTLIRPTSTRAAPHTPVSSIIQGAPPWS